MIKALIAATAFSVCCLGNPAALPSVASSYEQLQRDHEILRREMDEQQKEIRKIQSEQRAQQLACSLLPESCY